MDVSRRSSLCTHVANNGSSAGDRSAGAAQSGATVTGNSDQLDRPGQEPAQGADVQPEAVVDLHARGRGQRKSASAGGSTEHRQYLPVRADTNHRNAARSVSGEAEIADRHQLQY